MMGVVILGTDPPSGFGLASGMWKVVLIFRAGVLSGLDSEDIVVLD